MCNIKYIYIDEDEPWSRILAAAALKICYTKNRLKGYSMVQLLFSHDIIILIKHMAGWELICHKNQAQINKDNICENSKIFYHDYTVRDKVVLTNNYAFKYENLYNGKFDITQCWTNGTVLLQCGATKIRYNIHHIKLYTSY